MEKIDYEGDSEITKLYIYAPTGLIVVNDDEGWFSLLKDHLGSSKVIVGSSISNYNYDPYGKQFGSSVGTDVSYQFTGQEYEATVDLHNFRARFYDSDVGIFYAADPAGQGFASYAYAGNNPIIYVDKDGRWFGIDDLIVSGVSFISGYLSHGVSTGNWGGEAIKSGLISAGTSWLAYKTGGAAAGLFFDPGSAGYAITASTVGGAVGGSTGSVANQLRYTGGVNWNSVGRSTLSGIGGGLAGGLTGQYISTDPILPGIVGGFVGGGIEGSYTGNGWEGALYGGWSGGVQASMVASAYSVYGRYLTEKYLGENTYNRDVERKSFTDNPTEYNCKDFLFEMRNAGAQERGVGFSPNEGLKHVGLDLGGNLYGNRFILSKIGANFPITTLTARSLSSGSWLKAGFYYKGVYFNKFSGAYGQWKYLEF